MKARSFVVAACCLGLFACGSKPKPRPEAAPPPVAGLSVSLVWEHPVDLDLYFTDPTQQTVYFANHQTHSGAQLRRDSSCADVKQLSSPFFEVGADERPMSGRYRVGVDFVDSCGGAAAQSIPYRVRARLGSSTLDVAGVARLRQFDSSVLEFEVTLEPLGLRQLPPSKEATMIVPAPRRR